MFVSFVIATLGTLGIRRCKAKTTRIKSKSFRQYGGLVINLLSFFQETIEEYKNNFSYTNFEIPKETSPYLIPTTGSADTIGIDALC